MVNRVGLALVVVLFIVAGFAVGWLARGRLAPADEIIAYGAGNRIQADAEEQTAPTCDNTFDVDRRQEVRGPLPFAPQPSNGEVFDRTIFNRHFETGTDKLTVDGLKKLDTIARSPSGQDLKLYMEIARDVVYDQAAPEMLAINRRELNAKRTASIERYLTASIAPRGVNVEVTLIEFLFD